jgi:hypothetical protein
VAAAWSLVGVAGGQEPPAPDFLRDVRPILEARCFECHGSRKQESGLQMDRTTALLEGGNSGPGILPGNSAESLLVEAIRGGGERITKMPPRGPALTDAEVATITRWIDEGASAPADEPAANRTSSAHWSFQPIADPPPPACKDVAWARSPLDRFVLSRLEDAGLSPSPEADRITLVRRLSFDLLGLPPACEEVDRFLSDSSPDAYERLVDRLLASPHYGERWGRQWLDIAHYADSNGYTIDGGRSIWKYRDWVIDALNRDLPFDQFTIAQLAGDLLEKASPDQIIATGFHRNTLFNEEGGTDPEQFRVEAVVDRVSTTGVAYLGLTLGCARCHDHKYDPISQREFYELFAIFNSADEPVLSVPTDQQANEMPALEAEIAQAEMRLEQVDVNSGARQAVWEAGLHKNFEGFAFLPKAAREALAIAVESRSKEQSKALAEEYHKVDPERLPLATRIAELKESQKQLKASITTTLVMRERPEPRETHIHLRGDFLHPGAKISPGVPAVLPRLVTRGARADRLDFARWLTAPGHPLTARVTVNRVWQAYFGRGLVATENDFGLQGDLPTHAELLDWLASRFKETWSLKSLHKLIVTSATYRQASRPRADLAAADPENKLLGRQTRLRLEAETIRDAALAASGLLNPEIGGPGVYPPQPEGIYRFTQQAKFWGENKGAQRFRRGMYTFLWRSSPYPFLKTFDVPDAVVACTRRVRSNTPLQALTMANDRALYEMAQGFGRTIAGDGAAGAAEHLRRAFRRALARDPAPGELSALAEYFSLERARYAQNPEDAKLVGAGGGSEVAAWTMVARVLLNLDEFVTRE